ncbi:MAG: DUF2178 domain-containing protein [Phycisphaerales bacterium]
MNREQKRALAIVVSMSVAAILAIAALAARHFDWRPARLLLVAAAVVQGTGVLVCLRVKPDQGAVTSDERDKQIEKNSHLAGFGAVYLFVIVVSFAIVIQYGRGAKGGRS